MYGSFKNNQIFSLKSSKFLLRAPYVLRTAWRILGSRHFRFTILVDLSEGIAFSACKSCFASVEGFFLCEYGGANSRVLKSNSERYFCMSRII